MEKHGPFDFKHAIIGFSNICVRPSSFERAIGQELAMWHQGTIRGIFVGCLATVAIAFGGGYAVLKSGIIPANADARPGGFELWAAKLSLDATLSREAPKILNPVAATDENLSEGVKLYAQHCVECHGTAAGEASASPIAKGMYPRPPQLATEGVEDDAEGVSYWKIKHGIRLTGMPSWSATLTDQQIWTLALFLKRMDKLPSGPQSVWRRVRN